jgi:RimJ/RimL family protein N-acetyltransferase
MVMRISGNQVVLRDEKHDTDHEDMFHWLNMEEWNYYDEPDKPFQPISREAFESQRKQPRRPVPGSHTWQVDMLDGCHLGWVLYYQLDEKAGFAYVGVCFPEPETWGKGNGTEALSLLINHLLTEVSLKEVRATTWTGNHRMRRLAEKCGFKEVGRSPHRVPVSVRGESLEFTHYCILSTSAEGKAGKSPSKSSFYIGQTTS